MKNVSFTPVNIFLISSLNLDVNNDFNLALDGGKDDLLLVAGDIAPMAKSSQAWIDFLNAVSVQFGQVVFILGNRDFYDSNIAEVVEGARVMAGYFDNVTFLENETATFGNSLRVLGATAWAPFDGADCLADAKQCLSDMQKIALTSDGELAKLNATTQEFLAEELAKDFVGKTLVMTHHLPSIRLVQNSGLSSLDTALASDWDTYLKGDKVDAWFTGANFKFGVTKLYGHGTPIYEAGVGYATGALTETYVLNGRSLTHTEEAQRMTA